MARRRHPKKEVEEALREAENAGWTVAPSPSGHRWGSVHCSAGRAGCRLSIFSTPRNPGNHARHIRRALIRCPHGEP